MILLISKKICLDFILLFETSSRHLSLSCLSIYLSAICLYYVCVYVCMYHPSTYYTCMYVYMYVCSFCGLVAAACCAVPVSGGGVQG